MTLECKLELRAVYGEWKIYPACETSKAFAEIAKTKTLTGETLGTVKRMGYRLQFVTGALINTDLILSTMIEKRLGSVPSSMGNPNG